VEAKRLRDVKVDLAERTSGNPHCPLLAEDQGVFPLSNRRGRFVVKGRDHVQGRQQLWVAEARHGRLEV
jgi:hypothetical protein